MTAIPCRDFDRHHPDQWFAESPQGHAEAARLCAGCPIAEQCLAVAMRAERGLGPYSRYGVFGGLTPDQRARLARAVSPAMIGGDR